MAVPTLFKRHPCRRALGIAISFGAWSGRLLLLEPRVGADLDAVLGVAHRFGQHVAPVVADAMGELYLLRSRSNETTAERATRLHGRVIPALVAADLRLEVLRRHSTAIETRSTAALADLQAMFRAEAASCGAELLACRGIREKTDAPASATPIPPAVPSSALRIVIADSHQRSRDALRALLDSEPGCEVVGEGSDSRETVALTRALRPDILLLKLTAADMQDLDVLREVSRASTSTRVVLLTGAVQKPDPVKALQLGVRGLVPKSSASAVLISAMRAVAAGGYWLWPETLSELLGAQGGFTSAGQPPNQDFGLTVREREVLSALLAAYGNKEIAQKFGISEKTVKHHLTNIFDKLGVSNRLELALFAIHHNLDLSTLRPMGLSSDANLRRSTHSSLTV